MPKLIRVVSGGQTGVDQAALRAARALGIEIGGWCPPGRVCETGKIPEFYPLRETPEDRSADAPHIPRSQRTEWNVRDSDGTLILWPSSLLVNDPGTRWTAKCASRYQKPVLSCDPGDSAQVKKVQEWLSHYGIGTLNVAGPREKAAPGVGRQAENFLLEVFKTPQSGATTDLPKGLLSRLFQEADSLPWWLGLLRSLAGYIGVPGLLYSLTALLIAITFATIVAVHYLNFSIVGGKVYLGGLRELGAHATVDAIAAFQTSGIQLRKGQTIRLTPDGRVNVATDHQLHLAQAVKGFIVQQSPKGRFPENILRKYPEVPLTEENVFYRDWVGPEGEDVTSDILDECKLRKDVGWGALMFVILPQEPSARTDPFEVLEAAHLTPGDLTPLPHTMSITATRDGWLAFIINEAILSPKSPSEDSRNFYSILKRESEELAGDVRHQIPLRSIPLIWYADNAGAFRIVVQQE